MDKGHLWVTLRIPIVKKAEKLVRVIPVPELNEILKRAADYGLVPTLFKESVNEKYLVMTQTSLDLCNVLGNTRTCGIRETKFTVGQVTVMPIEFAHNRFLILGLSHINFKVMSKCPSGIAEHTISTDSVWLVPNNCSYSSNYLSIETREADVAITKEIGIVHFDKFEVSQVKSRFLNNTLLVEEVLNGSKSTTFERNRNKIKERLDNIKTSHESFHSSYSLEKWIIIAALVMLAVIVLGSKLLSAIRKKRLSRLSGEEFELGLVRPNLISPEPTQSQQQQLRHEQRQQQQQQQQCHLPPTPLVHDKLQKTMDNTDDTVGFHTSIRRYQYQQQQVV
jgi:hypothetical protein